MDILTGYIPIDWSSFTMIVKSGLNFILCVNFFSTKSNICCLHTNIVMTLAYIYMFLAHFEESFYAFQLETAQAVKAFFAFTFFL